MKEKKSLHAPKRISHGEAIFHARSALHKSVRISFVEKKKQMLSHLLPFFLVPAVGHLGPRAAASARWPRNGACDATAAERHAFDRANQAALTLAFLGSHGSHPGFTVPTADNKEKAGHPYGYSAFWCRRWDTFALSAAHEWRLRFGMAPAGAHLTPWVLVRTTAKQKAPRWGALLWCRRWDSNPHDVAIGGF